MKVLPDGAVVYQRTRAFDTTTVPAALLHAHRTRAGVWGRIVVEAGELLYRIDDETNEHILLRPGRDGIVEPQVPHAVQPRGDVRFHVEFLRLPQ